MSGNVRGIAAIAALTCVALYVSYRIFGKGSREINETSNLLLPGNNQGEQQQQQQKKQKQQFPSDNAELRDLFISMEKNENTIEEVARVVREMAERLEVIPNTLFAALHSVIATKECVDEVLRCFALAKTPSSIAAFAFAVENFAQTEELKRSLTTREVRDWLSRSLSLATTVDSLIHVCIAIGNVCFNNLEGQKLFSTPAVRDTIVIAFPLSTTAESVRWVANAVVRICAGNPEGQNTFATPAVRDAIIAAFPHATTAESVGLVTDAIRNICASNPDGQKLFTILAVRDAILASFLRATTADSVARVTLAIGIICFNNPEGQALFSTLAVRDAIVAAFPLAKIADTVENVTYAIGNICSNNPEGFKLFSFDTIRDAIIAAFLFATTADSVRMVTYAIGNICGNNAEGKKLFSTPAVRDAIVAAFPRATTPKSIQQVTRAIGNICGNNPEGQKLFSTPAVRDAIIAAFPRATTPESVRMITYAIGLICNSSEGQALFSIETVRDAIVAAFPVATTDEGVKWVTYAIGNICASNPEGQKLFSSPAVRDAIVAAFPHATTPESILSCCVAIGHICNTESNMILFSSMLIFSTPAVCKFLFDSLLIENVQSFTGICFVIRQLHSPFFPFLQDEACRTRFFNAFRSITSSSDQADTRLCVRFFCYVIGDVGMMNPELRKVISPEVVKRFPEIFRQIMTLDPEQQDYNLAKSNSDILKTFLNSPDLAEQLSTNQFLLALGRFKNKVKLDPEFSAQLNSNQTQLAELFAQKTISVTLRHLLRRNLLLNETDVVIGDQLAKGGYGVIHSGECEINNAQRPCVIKSQSRLLDTYIEAKNCSSIKHRNIVEFYGLLRGKEPKLVFELAQFSLVFVLTRHRIDPLPLRDIYNILLQTASGLSFLHSKSLIHFDLKPANILVFNNKTTFKIADFGTNVKEVHEFGSETEAVTKLYAPPEFGKNNNYSATTQFDVYSFGIIVLEFLARESVQNIAPIVKSSALSTEEFNQRLNPRFPNSKLWRLALHCVSIDPSQRPKSGLELFEMLKKACEEDCTDEVDVESFVDNEAQFFEISNDGTPEEDRVVMELVDAMRNRSNTASSSSIARVMGEAISHSTTASSPEFAAAIRHKNQQDEVASGSTGNVATGDCEKMPSEFDI